MPTPRSLFKRLSARPDAEETLILLQDLVALEFNEADLLTFHEFLLFFKAYPPSLEIRDLCEHELKDFPSRVALLTEELGESPLQQTGIVSTRMRYPYDLSMAKWLRKRLKTSIEVDWEAYDERGDDPLRPLLPLLMERAEGDAIDSENLTTREILTTACGRAGLTALSWLVRQFEQKLKEPARSHIYNSMELTLDLRLDPRGPSRSLLADHGQTDLILWNPQEPKLSIDLRKALAKPIEIPDPEPAPRGQQLLDLACGTLLVRQRELYAATFSNPAEVYNIPVGRGVCFVIWFMQPAQRLPLEAGWGMLVIKNNVPIGYGAGSLLPDRCEIALNVFDTFRGGEAAWLYSQCARVFRSLSGADWLVTRKYQIGYENDEGLASGSFWFYDKLGFRSIDPEIRKLADQERTKIAREKGYRSPRRTLKKLCQADVVLSVRSQDPSEYREFPLDLAGLAAARTIATYFDSRRDKLESRVLHYFHRRFKLSFTGWTAPEKARFAQMGLIALAIVNLETWNKQDLRNVFSLCKLKGSVREADYIRASQSNRKFFKALANVDKP